MRKILTTLVLVLTFAPLARAANGSLLWSKRAGGTNSECARAIGVDAAGNGYVAGCFNSSATFGAGEANEITLTASPSGSINLFLAKYAGNGALVWAKRVGGSIANAKAEARGIAVDSSGNSYVTGFFFETVTFGLGEANQTVLSADGGADIFVAKFDTNGAVVWAKRAGSTVDDEGYGVAVDGSGNSYVTGHFSGGATFGAGEANQTILSSSGVGDRDIFIAKFAANGALAWAKRAGGTDIDNAYRIAVDGSGNSHITGAFNGSATFGLGEANETLLTSAGSGDVFAAKFNANGALLWAKRAGGTGNDEGGDLAVDASGNAYVAGFFFLTATFGPGEGGQTQLNSAGSGDIFLAKFSSSGDLQWAKRAGGTSNDRGNALARDGAGALYVTGSFIGTATFGPGEANQTALNAAGSADVFIAKFSSGGALLWAKRAGGTSADQALGIAIGGSGDSYITGLFQGTATFGSGEINQTQITSGGSEDVFVAKFSGCKPAVDFDGDCKSDIAVYRSGLWIYSPSSGGANVAVQFGGGTDVPMPADYDGDGKTDIAVYRSGLWIYQPSIGGANVAIQFGGGTDVPMPGDYDGDGKTDIAVYRNGLWIYAPSSGGANVAVQFGGGTDVPMPGDYDGDGKTDIAVYRNGLWIYAPSTGGANVAVQFGGGTDVPVPADYDGDGKADIAVYRDGLWIILRSSDSGVTATQFGGGTDIPVPPDYDGDGRTDIAVYRGGLWIILRSSDSTVFATQFGGGTDVPLN